MALLLVLSLGTATAQTEVETRLEVTSDPPTPPWTADPEGDETLLPTNVRICWGPMGVNPEEGEIVVTLTLPANTDPWTFSAGTTEWTHQLPVHSLDAPEEQCELVGSVDITLTIGPFDNALSGSFTATVSGEAGNIGTFSPPPDATSDFTVEVEPDVDPFEDTGTENETEDEETDPPETEDSPAPGLVLFVGFAAALVSLLRRRH